MRRLVCPHRQGPGVTISPPSWALLLLRNPAADFCQRALKSQIWGLEWGAEGVTARQPFLMVCKSWSTATSAAHLASTQKLSAGMGTTCARVCLRGKDTVRAHAGLVLGGKERRMHSHTSWCPRSPSCCLNFSLLLSLHFWRLLPGALWLWVGRTPLPLHQYRTQLPGN